MDLIRILLQCCTSGLRDLFVFIVMLVILMMVMALHLDWGWKPLIMAVLQRSHTMTKSDAPLPYVRALLPNHTNTEEEEQKMETEILSIEQAVQNKMLFSERKIVNPHCFKYIHNVPDACHGTKVELLIGVPARTDSFELRTAIRETWGQSRENPENRTVTVFFLGTTSDDHVQNEIDKEALEFGDIVQEDFLDTYQNLSLKSVALVKWVSLYCPNSTFVLKADEDLYINTRELISALHEHYKWCHVFIIGDLRLGLQPDRNSSSKYYLSYEQYRFNRFPAYIIGAAYAMTTTAAMKLYIESLYVPIVTIEDVYLTGIVAGRAGIPKFLHEGFYGWKIHPKGSSFLDKISGHFYNATEMRKIHMELLKKKITYSFKWTRPH